ncbi:MAG: hypothetical protein K9G62_00855 [Alphaproteobacteria bacterium]|nr:hypothetical protein [Alphaproteobacteria bacterium]
MPHITVFYAPDDRLDMPVLLHDLHESLSGDPSVNKSQTKAYALPMAAWINGDGKTKPDRALHVQVRLLPGRAPELKRKMSEALHAIARKHVNDRAAPFSVSVEMHELDKDTYISSHE